MNQLFTCAAFVLAITIFTMSCNKDNNTTNPGAPSTPHHPSAPEYQALIQQEWRLTNLTAILPVDYDNDGDGETQIYAEMPACQQDNLFSFVNDSVYVVKEGATKCNSTDPDISYTDTWAIAYPVLNLGGQDWTIETLDDHNLVFYFATQIQGEEQKVVYTFKR